MNEELMRNVNELYRTSEQKANDYFELLSKQLKEKAYVSMLTKDIQSWKQNHIQHSSMLSLFSNKKKQPSPRGYHNYIQWLNHTGKLDYYLERSISYIYMRDLGKSLDSLDIQIRIRHVVDSLKQHLAQSTITNQGSQTDPYNMVWLYRLAEKEGVEAAMIWVINKLKTVSSKIPKEMDADEAKRKLIKIIAGVIINQIEEMDDEISLKERTKKLDEAIRLGYSYGLTYPFIDDLLDSEVLSAIEKKQYTDLIRTTLITGTVPELETWPGKNKDLIHYIHSELRDAFTYIKGLQQDETRESFFEHSYVFFQSQEVDRVKELSNSTYTNKELFIPIILKSASSRLIVRSVISAPLDEGFNNRAFFYGIYNQLADDFADMFDDMKAGVVTPYTYYMKYHDRRTDLINPFELYWTVIVHLIHDVYHSDSKTRDVILSRAINGLKRFKERIGNKKYNEVMELFASRNPSFNRLIQNLVKKANDVDFFDKLIRDHIIINFKNERKEREGFLDTIQTVRNLVNEILHIPKAKHESNMKEPIVDAANYSLEGDAKRLRPIMTWVMGVQAYGLESSTIIPLLRSLEYMHTASLIFDDLPAQDNASLRRGRPTIHQVYNTAVAELTGLYLTQKAVEEQASLEQFDPKTILELIRYSAEKTTDMCKGQTMDLDSKGKKLTVEQLNTICFYKTGIGFEASFVMPAILAGKKESEIEVLKKIAYHAGIAFQIKDDLLDVEGEQALLGKPVGKDAANNNSNFVSTLGIEAARKALWEHYCFAMEAVEEIRSDSTFLKHLLDYIMNRDH